MTKGQIEAKISEIVSKFEVELVGRGPNQIKTIVIEDLIIIREKGFLTPSEKKLVEDIKGIELVKKARIMLFEKLQKIFRGSITEAILLEEINIEIVSVHSDISTKTDEKVIVISLSNNLEKSLDS